VRNQCGRHTPSSVRACWDGDRREVPGFGWFKGTLADGTDFEHSSSLMRLPMVDMYASDVAGQFEALYPSSLPGRGFCII